ncbi:MAG TPA: hypothetical protein VFF26_12195 [Gallionella sp.]|nr:hypothetical protein [Gallionella sp.]
MKRGMATKSIVAALSASIVLGGCATPNGGGGGGDQAGMNECMMAALIGGIAGAAINDNNRAAGAAVGAALGALACVIVTANTTQTKQEAEVQSAYKKAHRGTLPANIVVDKYQTSVSQNVTIGKPFRTDSEVVVIPGKNQPVNKVEEQITMFDPSGKQFKQGKKTLAESGGGAWNNSFTATLQPGVPQGVYPIKTALFVNGNLVKGTERQMRMQVTAVDGGYRVAMLEQ